MFAIAYAAWGREDDVEFDLPNGVISAEQLVERLNLKPFVDVVRTMQSRCGPTRRDFAWRLCDWLHGGLPHSHAREVTAFAMLRTADYEILLETLDGEYFGFVGEGEVEKLTDTRCRSPSTIG